MHRRLVVASLFLSLLGLGAYRSLAPRTAADRLLAEGVSLDALAAQSPPPEPGTFPTTWIHGADCSSDPQIQVHAYNDNLYILRQSKCDTYEAPFLFLLFGDEKALLMDTGAYDLSPVWETVDRVVRAWLRKNNMTSIELIVAHTHGHGDHIASDWQFPGKPFVSTVVALDLPSVTQFWGFTNFPYDQPSIDLGNRVIDVLGSPGHEPTSVTLYDRRTQLLLTGDIVYPGHLFVFFSQDWPVFKDSVRRLAEFAALHPVEWVVGCHIEMGAAPFSSFKYGTVHHPNEHSLELRPDVLLDIYKAAAAMGNQPQCQIFDEFVIHPVNLCGIFWNG